MSTPSCGGFTCSPPCRAGATGDRRMPLRVARVWLAAGLWLLAPIAPVPPVQAADYPLETIELRARLPEDVIQILRPLAGPDGTLIGSGNTLFVRASPARLADIRQALATLDQPPRSLLIQVRQSGSDASSGMGAGVQVDEPLGRDGRIRVGPSGLVGRQAGAWAGRGTGTRDLSQEVRALDGRPAYISVGWEEPVPYREIETGPGRGRATVREGTYFQRADSGFYVVPRVLGDSVTLDVSAGTAQPGRRGGLATSSAGSQVRGQLGEWISLGRSVGSQEAESIGLLSGARGQHREESQIQLRVLPLD